MNEALQAEWVDRGIAVAKIAPNPITLNPEDMKKIQEMEDSATYGSNPFMMAGRMTTATANAMETAAANENGAMMGFMGMNMTGNAMGGGFNAAQQFYNMGVQQQQQAAPAPAALPILENSARTAAARNLPEFPSTAATSVAGSRKILQRLPVSAPNAATPLITAISCKEVIDNGFI